MQALIWKAESSDPDVTAKLSRNELTLRFLSFQSQAGFCGLTLGVALGALEAVKALAYCSMKWSR